LTTSLHTVTSYPVDDKATLGSLYDGLTDRVLTTPFISDRFIKLIKYAKRTLFYNQRKVQVFFFHTY